MPGNYLLADWLKLEIGKFNLVGWLVQTVIAQHGVGVDPNSAEYKIGGVVGAMTLGALCGLLPRHIALRRGRPGLAYGALGVCVVAGLIGGYLLAVPGALVLTAAALALPRRRARDRWARRETSDAKKILGVVLGLAAFGVASMVGYYAVRGPSGGNAIESELRKMADEANKQLPKQMDAVTRWDRVEAGPGNSVSFIYTLSAELRAEEKLRLEDMVTRQALTAQEMKPILQAGATLWYKYFDQGGRKIHEFSVVMNGKSPHDQPASSWLSQISAKPSDQTASTAIAPSASPPPSTSGAAAPDAAAVGGPVPRYGFQPDRYYGYDVKIVAETPEYVKTMSGYSLYRGLSVQGDRIKLSHEGHLDVDMKLKVNALPPSNPGGGVAIPATLIITTRGQVVSLDETMSLPYVLGCLETIHVEELPARLEKHWRSEQDLEVSQSRMPIGSRANIRNPGHPGRGAKETIDYTLGETRGDLLTIQKTYQMQTGDQPTGGPRVQMNGTGQFVFDLRQGMVASISMKYTVVSQHDAKPETASVSVECLTMNSAKLDQLAKEAEQRRDRQTKLAYEEMAKMDIANNLAKCQFRTWRDSTGKFEVEAKLIAENAGKVKLQTREGKEIEILRERLSQSDQDYVTKVLTPLPIAKTSPEEKTPPAQSGSQPAPAPSAGWPLSGSPTPGRPGSIPPAGSAPGVPGGMSPFGRPPAGLPGKIPPPTGIRPGDPVGAKSGVGRRTEMIGGSGGAPFELVGLGDPVVGFDYAVGQWAGKKALARLNPVFQRRNGPASTRVVAKEGYVVGGLEVDAPEFVSAVRIVFVRLGSDQRPNPADSYSSDWLGEPSGRPAQTIQSNGAKVIGVCGRRAAVVDAIGLVLE